MQQVDKAENPLWMLTKEEIDNEPELFAFSKNYSKILNNYRNFISVTLDILKRNYSGKLVLTSNDYGYLFVTEGMFELKKHIENCDLQKVGSTEIMKKAFQMQKNRSASAVNYFAIYITVNISEYSPDEKYLIFSFENLEELGDLIVKTDIAIREFLQLQVLYIFQQSKKIIQKRDQKILSEIQQRNSQHDSLIQTEIEAITQNRKVLTEAIENLSNIIKLTKDMSQMLPN